MTHTSKSALAGLVTVVVIVLIIGLSVTLFRGDFTKSETVTLISDRAGLVMNPDAKVKMRGVEVARWPRSTRCPTGAPS